MPGIVRVPSLYNGRRSSVPVYGTPGGLPRILREASSWYDARDLLTTTQQTLPNRLNPSASAAQLGSTSGSDTNDPVALPYDGTAYVYLPGTAGNNLSLVKGAWAGTLHVTATLVDNSTATYTTTADPVLIGNVLLGAGRYKKFVVRDTDGSGTVRVTIEPSAETVGQASWTCTTGQTVTVNRSTSGLTTSVVTRPLLMADGTDDYIQLPAGGTPTFTATTGAYTVVAIYRYRARTGVDHRVFSTESGNNNGLHLYHNTSGVPYAFVGGATTVRAVTTDAGTALTDGTVYAHAAIVDNGTVICRVSGFTTTAATAWGAIGTITHNPPRWGCRGFDVGSLVAGELLSLTTHQRALSVTEFNTVADYLLGAYS